MRFSLALLTTLLAGVSTAERRVCATFYGGGEYKTLSTDCGGWGPLWNCDKWYFYMGKRYTNNREWTHVKVAAGAELHFVTNQGYRVHWRKFKADNNWQVNDGWYQGSRYTLNEVYCEFKYGDNFRLERAATIYEKPNRGGAKRDIWNECSDGWFHRYCTDTYETNPSSGYGRLVYGSPQYWRKVASSIHVYGGWKCEMSRFHGWPFENMVYDISVDTLTGNRWWNFHRNLNNNLAEVKCYKTNVRRRAEADTTGEAAPLPAFHHDDGPESRATIQIVRGMGVEEVTEQEPGVFVAPDDWEGEPEEIVSLEETDAKPLVLDVYVEGTFPDLEALIAQEKAALAEEPLRAPDAEESGAAAADASPQPNPLTSRLAAAESKSEEARQG